MTSQRGVAWGVIGALAVAAVMVAQAVESPKSSPQRVGQIVFVPGESAPTTDRVPGVGSVTVVRCEETPDGLLVQGHVEASDTVTGVLVAPGDPQGAGLAVSAGFASSAGKISGAEVGDFVVTLAWASPASTFSVMDVNSLDVGSGAVNLGPPGACPPRP